MDFAAAPILDADSAYRAIVAHDARFDGRLYVGVTSTGVYCRPVCRVRTPLRRNCRFYANAASAEAGGFRPCLRCRPELAPGLALVDSPQVLAQHAARMLDAAARAGDDIALPEVAARLGVTDRHLRRIFAVAHGVTPIDYLTTQRLLLAKQLLTDTDLAVADVALAAGFGSQRRFNAAFAERYRLNPTALRRERVARSLSQTAQVGALLRLGYRPPYDVRGVVRFFADRCVPGVEAVDRAGSSLRRTLAWQQQGRPVAGWLAARFLPDRNEVEVAMSPSLAPAAGAVLQRVRQGLDLDADPAPIDAALSSLPGPAGVRAPNGFCGWEIAVRVILGQQVTVAAARTLTARLVERFGEPIATPFADLTRLFPTAANARGRQRRGHRHARHRASARRRVAGAGARGGGGQHRAAPRRSARTHARRAARIARHRRVDSATDRDARTGLARCISCERHRRAQRAEDPRHQGLGSAKPGLAAVAFVCRDAAVAIPGDRNMTFKPTKSSMTAVAQAFAGVPLVAQAVIDTPIGPLTALATGKGIAGLWFDDQTHHPGALDAPIDASHQHIVAMRRWLEAYWAGRDPSPREVPLDLHGTAFQRAVWKALLAIPMGRTKSYGEVAAQLGSGTDLRGNSATALRADLGTAPRADVGTAPRANNGTAPRANNGTAPRAVGAAVGRNPVSILVPCHRVIGADGSLTGYAGGLPRKERLLQHEGVLL